MKHQRRAISGVLLFDKSTGLSSNHALQQVKRLFNAEKTGHTGTLDPLASGLLPLMFGQATKFASDLIEANKTYETTVRLGYTSSTGDAEGDIQASSCVTPLSQITLTQAQAVCTTFHGEVFQTPPMYSALKKDGKALYEYARNGEEVERTPRAIQIHSLNVLELYHENDDYFLKLEVTCSKGTYVRTLGEDIAKALGTGGYLTALRRTRIGGLSVQNASTLEQLQAIGQQETDPAMLLTPVDSLLTVLGNVSLNLELAKRFLHGQRLPLELTNENPGRVKVYYNTSQISGNEKQALFLGTGILETDGKGALLRPDRLIQVTL